MLWYVMWLYYFVNANAIVYAGTKNKEDAKLVEGVKIQAIERRSIPLQAKLREAKTNNEMRVIRRQIRQLRYLMAIAWCK